MLAKREVRATLDALEAAGRRHATSPSTCRTPTRSAPRSTACGASGARSPRIVHGAGVLADKRIADKTDEQFDRVFDTKVDGLRALLAATARDPLSAICLFSSVAARTGNLGQCDYAMANEVLNKVAAAERARRGAACRVRSIGWGPWGRHGDAGARRRTSADGRAAHPAGRGRAAVRRRAAGRWRRRRDRGRRRRTAAAPLGAEAAPARHRSSVRVDAASHPYLADHRDRADGRWCRWCWRSSGSSARRARRAAPTSRCAAVRDVKVLRGIKLERFDRGGDLVHVRCRQVAGNGDGAEIAVELRGRGDALHYRAAVEMTRRPPAAPPTPRDAAARGLRRGRASTTAHVLFHGPRFQVIARRRRASRARGSRARSRAARRSGGRATAWRTDPALLDGGLQLALLWARHVLGGASLPMAVGELPLLSRGPRGGPGALRGARRARPTRSRAVCDIAFADASGAVVAELLGVETVLRPDDT